MIFRQNKAKQLLSLHFRWTLSIPIKHHIFSYHLSSYPILLSLIIHQRIFLISYFFIFFISRIIIKKEKQFLVRRTMTQPLALTFKKSYRTSIISNFAFDPQFSTIALITYKYSNTSSKRIYTLETLSAAALSPLKTRTIQQTYSEDKRQVTMGMRYVYVATEYFIEVYEKASLERVKKWKHGHQKVNQMGVSGDQRFLGVVGNGVSVWDVVNLQSWKEFENINSFQWFNFVHFTKIDQSLVIGKIDSLRIYKYSPNNQNFTLLSQFPSLDPSTPQQNIPQNSYINSLDSSPINPDELVVGLQEADPHYFSISLNTFFKKNQGSQPNLKDNIKMVRYMPDGRGFLSADGKGFALWTASGEAGESFVNYLGGQEGGVIDNAIPSSHGTVLFNFVWKEARVYKIGVTETGRCRGGEFWSVSNQGCLSCERSCRCELGFVFDQVTGICLRQCAESGSRAPYRINADPTKCMCSYPFQWDAPTNSCVINCLNFPLTSSKQPLSLSPDIICPCIPNFEWSHQKLQCECPDKNQYFDQLANSCICIPLFEFDPSTRVCSIKCTELRIPFLTGENNGTSSCVCESGLYFKIEGKQMGCKRDCSIGLDNVVEGVEDFSGGCVCQEHYIWDKIQQKCVVDCSKASELGTIDPNNNSSCLCPVNYSWSQNVAECVRNCTNVPYAITENSTNKNCQCRENFEWSFEFSYCEIQCEKVARATQYRISSHECECQSGFDWSDEQSKCEINCGKIDDGFRRISETKCQCRQGKVYDEKKAICENPDNGLILGNIWITAGIIAAGFICLVLVLSLIRFCCRNRKEKIEGVKKEAKNGKKISLAGLYKKYEIKAEKEDFQPPLESESRNIHTQK